MRAVGIHNISAQLWCLKGSTVGTKREREILDTYRFVLINVSDDRVGQSSIVWNGRGTTARVADIGGLVENGFQFLRLFVRFDDHRLKISLLLPYNCQFHLL